MYMFIMYLCICVQFRR